MHPGDEWRDVVHHSCELRVDPEIPGLALPTLPEVAVADDAVHLGEESGRLAETLDKHFKVLQMRVRFAMTALTQLASTVVWVVVSALLVFVIFKIFGRYLALGPGAVDAAVEKVMESRSGN